MLCAETYLIAPSLTLVRSKNPDNREVGVGRVSRWHSSGNALAEVVAQGGAEALLAALPTAVPASRVLILELLVKMAGRYARTRVRKFGLNPKASRVEKVKTSLTHDFSKISKLTKN